MAGRTNVLLTAWLHDRVKARLASEFPELDVALAIDRGEQETRLTQAEVVYGCPPLDLLGTAERLRWLQLSSAGVPAGLADVLRNRDVRVTNLAGLYGPSIAEHALGLMLMLARNLHRSVRQQIEQKWDRSLDKTMFDLHGKTVAILGLGNIGTNIARLCQTLGMRVVGCRRTARPTPFVDQVFERSELPLMLGEADFLIVAAPLTAETHGMLGPSEFDSLKPGAFYVNISRGPIVQEEALIQRLQTGEIAGAGLDVFAVEPLPADHFFWTHPNVIVTPHYSGQTVNTSAQPGELFLRNLRAYLAGEPIGNLVDLAKGY